MATKLEACYLAWFYTNIRELFPAPEDFIYQKLKKGFQIETGLEVPTLISFSTKIDGMTAIPVDWKYEELKQDELVNREIIYLRWFYMNASEECYRDAFKIKIELCRKFEKKFNVRLPLDGIDECENKADLHALNRDLTAKMASELQFLRYYRHEAGDYMGPASDDIYALIDTEYTKKSGFIVSKIMSNEGNKEAELSYLRYFYENSVDGFCGSEGDIQRDIIERFEKLTQKRTPSFYREGIE